MPTLQTALRFKLAYNETIFTRYSKSHELWVIVVPLSPSIYDKKQKMQAYVTKLTEKGRYCNILVFKFKLKHKVACIKLPNVYLWGFIVQ